GRAAGMFFAGYFFFQVPSNLILDKVGVRRWISALMVAWGVISCLMIFIRGPVSFYGMRFLLGAAEAGFFPGMILYMKRWFPARARARAVAWFMTANPLAGLFGSPISGALLGIHSASLAGWQWMFLIEGTPAILLGLTVLVTLAERPDDARWLRDDERDWLQARLAEEGTEESAPNWGSVWEVVFSLRIWMLALVYFAVPTTMYGVTLWLPSVIRALSGLSYVWTGIVAALPFAVAVVLSVLGGIHSDRTGERRWHTAIPAFTGAAALLIAGYGSSPALVIACFGLSMACAQTMSGPFWALATSRLEGLSAPAGIAVINSLANLGGYFGPDIIGLFRTVNGGFRGGLLAIGATLIMSGSMALALGRASAPKGAAGKA
ncbi:MAG TPA: MFS transporter, partial [Candidatus Acidoferrales bacterium]|nr:MFS transporter [Candidatus Acidoferrales bacterium]